MYANIRLERWAMEEQRKEPRMQLNYHLRVFDRSDNSLFGHIVDVSPTGMLISCDRDLNSNHQYQLSVEDTSLMDRLDVISFDAQCKWHTEGKSDLITDGGFELLAPSKPIKQMIASYCQAA
ncbi:MAG: hypothetical protein COA99_12270 [Moraxellaceae bacterium]|nr:MAG: hypothetical protein COA99_12270 [Moraxellaceae bacterium]